MVTAITVVSRKPSRLPTATIPSAHRQICKRDFELEGAACGPSNGLGNHIRQGEMRDEIANTAPSHAKPKKENEQNL